VGALHHVDRVDLHQSDPADHPAQVPDRRRAGRMPVGEPLRGKGDPTRLGERKVISPAPQQPAT
jgi:hypothetical protein